MRCCAVPLALTVALAAVWSALPTAAATLITAWLALAAAALGIVAGGDTNDDD